MIVYISGAITGHNDYKMRFSKAEQELRRNGYTVLNPAVLPKGLSKTAYMPICLAMLDAADAIYMLDGWKESGAARIEFEYADYHGKQVMIEGNAKNLKPRYSRGCGWVDLGGQR